MYRESLFVSLAGVALWWGYVLLRPESFNQGAFLFRDYSQYLFTIDAILKGEALYRDVFWQYGPLPMWYHALFARLLGNTPAVWAMGEGLLQALNCGLVYAALRNGYRARPVLLAGIVTFVPLLLRWSMGLTYFGFESLFLLAALSLWGEPGRRTAGRALLVGLLLGLVQWAKFGSAFAAGAGLVMVDALLLWRRSESRVAWVAWFRLMLVTGLGFAVTEGALAAWAFATLPASIALDVVWPIFMKKQYAFASGEAASVLGEGAGVLIGTVVPAIAGGLGGLVCLREVWQGRVTRPVLFGLLITAYFAVGWGLLFKHAWLLFQYSALLSVPAAVGLLCLRGALRIGMVLLALCGAVVLPYKIMLQHAHVAPLQMPNGQVLWLDETDRATAQGIFSAVAKVQQEAAASAKDVLILPWVGSGLHFFGNLPHAARYTLYMPGMLRDYDRALVWASLDRTAALIISLPAETAGFVSDDPLSWGVDSWSPFDAAHSAYLRERLGKPIRAGRKWFVFPVNHPSPMPLFEGLPR